MAIWTWENAVGAAVTEVETGRRLRAVRSIDTAKGLVTCYEQPYRVVDGDCVTYAEQYETIRTIYGLEPRPVLFHCYGWKQTVKQ